MYVAVRYDEILNDAIEVLRSTKGVVTETPAAELERRIEELDVMLSTLLEDHRRKNATWKEAVRAVAEGGDSDEDDEEDY